MRPALLLTPTLSSVAAQPVVEKGALALRSIPGGHYQFRGVAGERIAENGEGWLLSAPVTNVTVSANGLSFACGGEPGFPLLGCQAGREGGHLVRGSHR